MNKKNGRRTSLLILLGLLSTSFLTGCWSSIELNNRSFVRMMLLDKAASGIELTLSFPLPNRLIPGQSGGTGELQGKPFTFVSATGDNISEAYRIVQSDLSRKITFGQTSVIVIGSELAKEGISQVLEFVAREPRFHINANLFITPGKAKELMLTPVVFERFPADILLAYTREHVTVDMTTKDCLAASYYGGDMIIPMLKFKAITIPSEKQKQQTWMGTDGAALFRDGKMVQVLNTYEMRGAKWILGKMKDAEISIPSPTDGKQLSYMVNQSRSKIRPVLSGGELTFHIECEADASLIASNSLIRLQEPGVERKLSQKLEAMIETRMKDAIESSKRIGADIFQLSSYLDWHYPQEWRNRASHWREEYRSKIKVVPHAFVTIKRLGTTKQPARFLHPAKEGGSQ